MKQLTILVDMDDTIERLMPAWLEVLNKRYGYSVDCEDILNWDVSKAFPGLSRDQVYGAILEEDFWRKVEPIPEAIEGLKQFMAQGHKVIIVTATHYVSVRSKMEDLLFKYFPFLSWDDVVITSRKQLLKGDVLIDDGFHNLLGGDYAKILVDAPYNRAFDAEANGMLRVYRWKEIMDEVRRLAEE